MIKIQQDITDGLIKLSVITNKLECINIPINKDAILNDIQLLSSKDSFSKKDSKNLKNIISYLTKTSKKIDENGCIELTWNVHNLILKSYPIDFMSIPEYGIEMTDYIDTTNGNKLVRIDYSDVSNIIALELAYKDLGYTFNDMENKLDSIGITGIYPAIDLLKHFNKNIINTAKAMRFSDSTYYRTDTKKLVDYFGQVGFKADTYREVITHSAKRAISLIAKEIMLKLNYNRYEYNLCSATENSIHMLFNEVTNDINEILSESVVVRAFGRRFEVKPIITIY